jgi:hypothetical protein
LVVVVVTDEIFDRIVWEKLFKFLVKLTGQRLVVHQDKRRFLHARDDIGHCKRLAGTGDAQQCLMSTTFQDAGRQGVDGPVLIPARLEWSFELK